jgi:hypothetical protein
MNAIEPLFALELTERGFGVRLALALAAVLLVPFLFKEIKRGRSTPSTCDSARS